jgi:hypothetical protein
MSQKTELSINVILRVELMHSVYFVNDVLTLNKVVHELTVTAIIFYYIIHIFLPTFYDQKPLCLFYVRVS